MAGPQRNLAPGGVWLLVGLAAMTAVSLALFPFTESRAGFFVRAIHRYDTLDLQRWAYTYDDNARSRYGPYLALDIAAPGSTVIIADGDFAGDPTVDQRLYSFGGVGHVIHVEERGADILGEFEPAPLVMASGGSTSHGPAWILCARPTTPSTVVSGYYVSHALAGGVSASTDARTFLLVSFPIVDDEGQVEDGMALIDASLLPPDALEAVGP